MNRENHRLVYSDIPKRKEEIGLIINVFIHIVNPHNKFFLNNAL